MQLGKPSRETLASTVWRFTGARSRAVIVGPTPGEDVAVPDIGEGRVLVANSDPISLIPSLEPEDQRPISSYKVPPAEPTTAQRLRTAILILNFQPHRLD